jgi:hypothetical protein
MIASDLKPMDTLQFTFALTLKPLPPTLTKTVSLHIGRGRNELALNTTGY